jgi:hypothetical protein
MPRAGASVSTGVDAKELRAFRQSLKAREDGKAWDKTLSRTNKRYGQVIVSEAQSRLHGASASKNIKASAGLTGISIIVSNTSAVPWTLADIWGAKKRTGWYAAERYEGGAPQHPPWVGNSWTVGSRGEGPYGVNAAIADKLDEVMDGWAEDIQQLMNEAMP